MNDAEFFRLCQDLSRQGRSFAVATVVAVHGSASSRPGMRSVLSAEGERLWGWVGGGCVESTAASTALLALETNEAQTVEVDLDDEVLGAGMPCGGGLTLFVQPYTASPHVVIAGHGVIAETIATLAKALEYRVTVVDPDAERERFACADVLSTDPSVLNEVVPGAHLVVATQHKGDHLIIKEAVERGAASIALIASAKRAGLVFEYVRGLGVPEERIASIRSPAGLDLGGRAPQEIALSVMSELVKELRGGSGRKLAEVKGTRQDSAPVL
jgi:xanthine dehydrogenase accessory factor